MSLTINDITNNVKNSTSIKEFPLNPTEQKKLDILYRRFEKYKNLVRPILDLTGTVKILLIDVETDTTNRDKVLLTGVFDIAAKKLLFREGPLDRFDLLSLSEGAHAVAFTAFNMGFDLARAFSDDCNEILLKRVSRIGQDYISYSILRKKDVKSFAFDIQRLARNLISDKMYSLANLSQGNKYFKKKKTDSFQNLEYLKYDLLSEFELLTRCMRQAERLFDMIKFNPNQLVSFIVKMHRFDEIESHMVPLKLCESFPRLAKFFASQYGNYPSLPGFYCGGRVRAFSVGNFKDFSYQDIASQYPGIISKLSPLGMKVNDISENQIAEDLRKEILAEGHIKTFEKYYIKQHDKSLLLSSWILIQPTKPIRMKVEALREKSKKSKKLREFTLTYRNKRQEQARCEGFSNFQANKIYQIPLYFLFMQSKSTLRKMLIRDCSGITLVKDPEWENTWKNLFQIRSEDPSIKTALKVLLNSVYGMLVDVDQPFSNLMVGGHITAFSRTISYIIEAELGKDLLYTDTDGFITTAHRASKLSRILERTSPFGYKKEAADAKQIYIFRSKRYAYQSQDSSWEARGGERFGGRERNKIMSYLENKWRSPKDDIRQVTKKKSTPEIPAARELLKDSRTGEWCYYTSYPLEKIPGDRITVIQDNENITKALTKGKHKILYLAAKKKEDLISIVEHLPPNPPWEATFEKSKASYNIDPDIFHGLFGHVDTTFLFSQVSISSLMSLTMENRERMKLMAKTIGSLGNSDNKGVKIAIENIRLQKGEIVLDEPWLKALPKRGRKKTPFSQRRFYIKQQFPYPIHYHLSRDGIDHAQLRNQKFIFYHKNRWIMKEIGLYIQTYIQDLQMLEKAINEKFHEVMMKENPFATTLNNEVQIRLNRYARYKRFDIAVDFPRAMVQEAIVNFRNICEKHDKDYNASNGLIGIRGRKHLTDSWYYVPCNYVIYDRVKRAKLKLSDFQKKWEPFIEKWTPDNVGRFEIQMFSSRSNNRKANPLASILNAWEMLRIKFPQLYDYLHNLVNSCLSITHMCLYPPLGSGSRGPKLAYSSPKHPSTDNISLLGIGYGYPKPPPREEDYIKLEQNI